MHLGDILDILSDECGDMPFGKVMQMARNIMELHGAKVRDTADDSYNNGYNSGMEVGKSMVSIPTPDQWETKKYKEVYDYQFGQAQAHMPNIIAKNGRDRKIQCIRDLRALTGLGLKDAKEIVDTYIKRLNSLESTDTYYGDEPPF